MGRFVLRPEAAADIDGIWEYSVEHWGIAQANKYASDIRAAIERVAENPRRGRPCGVGHFKMLVGSDVVIYRILDTGIGIIRVLHQAMDLPRHLKPPPPA